MVDFIISLDGYGAAEGWPGYWGLEGPEYLGWLEEQEEHTTLMGATTYRLMSAFAAEMPDELAALTAMPKVVFSSTLEPPLSWANTDVVSEDPVQSVADMKRHGTRPLRTLGSLTLGRALLLAGLVDRFRVVVSRLSPAPPARTGSSTGTPTLRSRWSTAGSSTEGCSFSSTYRRCSRGRRWPASRAPDPRPLRRGDLGVRALHQFDYWSRAMSLRMTQWFLPLGRS